MKKFYLLVLLLLINFVFFTNCKRIKCSGNDDVCVDYFYTSFSDIIKITNSNDEDIIVKTKFYKQKSNYSWNGGKYYINLMPNENYIFNYEIYQSYGIDEKIYYKNYLILNLEILDKEEKIKYNEFILGLKLGTDDFYKRGIKNIYINNSEFYDTSLTFERNNYKFPYTYHDNTNVYLATFNSAKVQLPASELRNYRLYNSANKNIKVKVYKQFIDEKVSWTTLSSNQNIYYDFINDDPKNIQNNQIADDTVFWETNSFKETSIPSGGVETIFISTLSYTGPYKIVIYDSTSNTKIFDDKVKFPFFDNNDLSKYTFDSNPFAEGLSIISKLDWKKKINTTSSIKSKGTISNYPNEFYAEYNENL